MPDRLPATTHHLMPSFLQKYVGGCSEAEFFEHFGLDAITWFFGTLPNPHDDAYLNPEGFTQTDNWIVTSEALPDPQSHTVRYTITTPGGTLSMVLASDPYTTWIAEHPIKSKSDIDLLGMYLPSVICDHAGLSQAVQACGERGIVRGSIPGFQTYGQPGCWQDAACLVGIEPLILATYDDPAWVHALLGILQARKKRYITSLQGAPFDLIELGGGDASSSVISTRIFNDFVAPYDSELIALAHVYGQRIVYHTCGGMMPILDAIADMAPDAMETFTPPAMGGDTDLALAKARISSRVCMIGGFDQFHHLLGCSSAETRQAVRACFEAAGREGNYILCPSDHFFDADVQLLQAFADEARQCFYGL
jgi:hypothetical protein